LEAFFVRRLHRLERLPTVPGSQLSEENCLYLFSIRAVSYSRNRLLRWETSRTEGPVILAGHAYAGAVITSVNDERVKALVYIAALAPDEGETVAQVFYRDDKHSQSWGIPKY
jgi:hypothetical protein